MGEQMVMGWVIVGILGVVGVGTLFKTQQKINEFTKEAEAKYVNQAVCKAVSDNVIRDLTEIKKDVKDLLKINGNKRG